MSGADFLNLDLVSDQFSQASRGALLLTIGKRSETRTILWLYADSQIGGDRGGKLDTVTVSNR